MVATGSLIRMAQAQAAWRCPKCGHAGHSVATSTTFRCDTCECILIADYSGRKVAWR